jgi:Capsule polysaccharide biosynthesis protein
MRFGFWFDYDHTHTFVKLFAWIQQQMPDAIASGYIVNDRYFAHASEHLPGSALTSLYDLVNKGRNYSPSAEEFAAFRIFDESQRLARVAYSDRFIQDWSHRELISLFIYLGNEFRAYIDRERPDVFVFNCVASQYAHLLYVILKEKRVQVLIPLLTGVDDLMYVADNAYFEWPDVVALFNAMKEGSAEPSPSETIWATKLIERVRAGAATYSIANAKAIERRKVSVPGVTRIASYIRYLDNYRRYYRHDPTLPAPTERLRSVIRFRQNRKKSARYFKDASAAGERFLFYPLHYEPEIATLVLSQYEQASAIDIIARQLPLSWRLVIKEHPLGAGQRPVSFYKEITDRYPNVVFLDADIAGNVLVRRASAVFTLSGTTILDALILNRPVIYTSPSRLGAFGLGVLTHDLINFGAALTAAQMKIATDTELVFMLSAIRRHSAQFKFVEPFGDLSVLEPDNIDKMGNALMTRVKAA